MDTTRSDQSKNPVRIERVEDALWKIDRSWFPGTFRVGSPTRIATTTRLTTKHVWGLSAVEAMRHTISRHLLRWRGVQKDATDQDPERLKRSEDPTGWNQGEEWEKVVCSRGSNTSRRHTLAQRHCWACVSRKTGTWDRTIAVLERGHFTERRALLQREGLEQVKRSCASPTKYVWTSRVHVRDGRLKAQMD